MSGGRSSLDIEAFVDETAAMLAALEPVSAGERALLADRRRGDGHKPARLTDRYRSDVYGAGAIGLYLPHGRPQVRFAPQQAGLTAAAQISKRAFDLLVAAVLLVPALIVGSAVAALIKQTSPGPILFRQTRVGRNGRRFEIVKFRTMVHNADALKRDLADLNEADGLFKIKDDPRLTRIGAWLRRTYLDELPQLINVLRGEMGIVGPRPLVVDEDAAIRGSGRQRLLVRPGMTGEWQVLRGGGASLDEMIAVDFRYVAEWSLWRDLGCLAKTIKYMLRRRGW